MRSFAAIALAASVFASGAFAAEVRAPLTPGKPATVKKAQMEGNTVMLLAGVAVVGGGIALVASEGNGTPTAFTSTSTTTGTNP